MEHKFTVEHDFKPLYFFKSVKILMVIQTELLQTIISKCTNINVIKQFIIKTATPKALHYIRLLYDVHTSITTQNKQFNYN